MTADGSRWLRASINTEQYRAPLSAGFDSSAAKRGTGTVSANGTRLDAILAQHTPTVTVVWADAGFKQDVGVHGAVIRIDVQVVKRCDSQPGVVPVEKRWIVEQVFGTLMLHRWLVPEHESKPAPPVSRTLWASTANMVRRLTCSSTSTWRNA